jgi:hypothetical protein
METYNFLVGDTVVKKSKRPFKNGEKKQTITGFGINEKDPKLRPCAIFSDGSTCNLEILNKIFFVDIETYGFGGIGKSFGMPTGFINSFSGTRKSNLVKFLPLENKSKGSHLVVIDDIENIDKLKLIDSMNLINFMKDNLNNEPPKCVKTEYEKIGEVTFPVTYFEDGVIIVDYPNKL